jgi:O-antigen ligase
MGLANKARDTGGGIDSIDTPLMLLRLPALVALLAAFAAAAAPSLLVYNVAPSPTFLNQALACALWGGFVLTCGVALPRKGAMPLLLALLLLAMAVCWSWTAWGLPNSLTLSALSLLAACMLLMLAGQAAGENDLAARGPGAASSGPGAQFFALFCWAWLGAGLLNLLVACIQVFAPGLADGQWVAVPNIAGRAMGNLRQPNHLSSLLMWACVAVVGLLLLRRLALAWAAVLLAALVFGVVLTASRTGGLSVALLALWALLDRRLPKPARVLLLATPLMYALAWWGLSQWAALSQSAFGGEQRLAETDISGSRFGIWANTWQLILQQPWTGVGFGNFNFAWTLTPFPGRPTAFFDHSHNLPLQLAAELGLPLAALVMALLLWALARGWHGALQHNDQGLGAAQRCALLMVVMIGLHSLLEYPLWYAYFLLPAAWAFGYALAGDGHEEGPARSLQRPVAHPLRWALPAGGALLSLMAVAAVVDYRQVTLIYRSHGQALPLGLRIAAGQRSPLFAHHGDYAAATSRWQSSRPGSRVDPAFDRASRNLLDTRLMMAWSQALAAQGDTDRARYLAARLREFGKSDAASFFEACPDAAQPAGTLAPGPDDQRFACEQPATALQWRDFLKTAR